MNNDNQIKHNLWWLMKFLPQIQFNKDATNEDNRKQYTDFMNSELSEDVCKEIDALVAHIKINY